MVAELNCTNKACRYTDAATVFFNTGDIGDYLAGSVATGALWRGRHARLLRRGDSFCRHRRTGGRTRETSLREVVNAIFYIA